MRPPLLLISATDREAHPLLESLAPEAVPFGWGPAWRGGIDGTDVVLAQLGVGKANTAAGLALALASWRPSSVVQLGIGGAFVGSFLSVGMVAAASCDVHVDCGAGEGDAWRGMRWLGFPLLAGPPPRFNEMPTDAGLTHALAGSADVPVVRFATSERVTGSLDEGERLRRAFDVSVESMEGAAAAQVCSALGVPFAELRGISNIVGETDRSSWDVPAAIRVASRHLLDRLPALAAQP